MPEPCGRRLRELAYSPHRPDVLAYIVEVHCLGDQPNDLTSVDHVKLIRNHPDLRFEFRIHEQVLPSIRRLGGEVARSGLHVVHHGSNLSEQEKQGKYERDLRILAKELADRPEHPFALFNLGMTYNDKGDHELALDYLRRSIAASGASELHLRKAYAFAVASLGGLDRWAEALGLCRVGLKACPGDAELRFRQVLILHELGRNEDALAAYSELLFQSQDDYLSSIDPGIVGHKAKHNMARPTSR